MLEVSIKLKIMLEEMFSALSSVCEAALETVVTNDLVHTSSTTELLEGADVFFQNESEEECVLSDLLDTI